MEDLRAIMDRDARRRIPGAPATARALRGGAAGAATHVCGIENKEFPAAARQLPLNIIDASRLGGDQHSTI